jgi:transposase
MKEKQLSHLRKFFPGQNDGRGRPATEPEAILQGIYYVLRTGCQWNAIPKCFGPSSTIHENFQKLVTINFFQDVWRHALEQYDRFIGLNLKEQSFDCAHTKAPLGGQATGISPVDRRKIGTKRSVLADKNGIPLAIGVTGANTHDSKVCVSTVSDIVYNRQPPFKTIELDAAFDAAHIKKSLATLGYYCRVSPNKRRSSVIKNEKLKFRWSVERTHSWINRFRRLLIRWEKMKANFLGMLQFACQIIVFREI